MASMASMRCHRVLRRARALRMPRQHAQLRRARALWMPRQHAHHPRRLRAHHAHNPRIASRARPPQTSSRVQPVSSCSPSGSPLRSARRAESSTAKGRRGTTSVGIRRTARGALVGVPPSGIPPLAGVGREHGPRAQARGRQRGRPPAQRLAMASGQVAIASGWGGMAHRPAHGAPSGRSP